MTFNPLPSFNVVAGTVDSGAAHSLGQNGTPVSTQAPSSNPESQQSQKIAAVAEQLALPPHVVQQALQAGFEQLQDTQITLNHQGNTNLIASIAQHLGVDADTLKTALQQADVGMVDSRV